ncbi:MAG TPA: hypothetical protein VFY39_16835, partial [Gammaproteobacteria bacterium]|nr:hypothetical protein [Gammaproteobacteria bacterium]
MRTVLMIVTALHVLAGVFWAGSTFAAHGVAVRPERLAYSQLGAAFVAVLAGGALWGLTQPYGTARTILSVGAGCAIVALGIQATALPAV